MLRFESLDTNIILRILLGDNAQQKRLASQLILNNDAIFYIDDYVIGEIVHVLEREHYIRSEISDLINSLLINKIFDYDRNLFDEVFHKYLTHGSMSFNDCYIATKVARHQAEPLWTFDHKFATQSPTAKELK